MLITRGAVLCVGFTGVVIIRVKSAFDFSAEEGEGQGVARVTEGAVPAISVRVTPLLRWKYVLCFLLLSYHIVCNNRTVMI